MQKVLITGASGYLANTLVPRAAQQAEVVGTARNKDKISDPAQALTLDVTRRASVLDLVLAEQPDVIIHCAASNPGGDEATMQSVNATGGAHIAEAAKRCGCRLIVVSSDTVFSGNEGPYADDAPTSALPENAYATSKADAEAAILEHCPDALIVRTSLIYGLDKIDRGTEGFVKRLKQGHELQLFTDVIRQPVFDSALADNLCKLAFDLVDESGTMNLAGDEACSRYSFGMRMLDYWKADYKDLMTGKSGVGIAGLPLDLRLHHDRAESLGLSTIGVSSVLKEYGRGNFERR